MDNNKTILKAVAGGFDGFTLLDWFMLAIGVLRMLSEMLESDGNGGVKPKE